MVTKSVESYKASAERGTQWLVSKLREDGSYGPGTDDIAYYYKGPYALSVTGHISEALRMLEHIKNTFMREDGDFRLKERKSENDFLNRDYYTYANAWIIMGAHRLGRFDISYKAMDFLMNFRDPSSGGFFSERPLVEGGGRIDTISASFNGLVCLYLGHLREAVEAGDFLVSLLEMQPKGSGKFFSSYSAEKGLITEFPTERALHYVVDSRNEKQWYFFVGYPAGYLSKLYVVTGNAKYLRAADGYFNFATSCREDVYHYPPSGKLAWGSAVSFKVTKTEKYRQAAENLAEYILRIQNPDGSWLYDGLYSSMDQQPLPMTFDLTQEFVSWLAEIALELG